MKKINKGIKLPSKKNEIDRSNIIDYYPTSIKEGLVDGFFMINVSENPS